LEEGEPNSLISPEGIAIEDFLEEGSSHKKKAVDCCEKKKNKSGKRRLAGNDASDSKYHRSDENKPFMGRELFERRNRHLKEGWRRTYSTSKKKSSLFKIKNVRGSGGGGQKAK